MSTEPQKRKPGSKRSWILALLVFVAYAIGYALVDIFVVSIRDYFFTSNTDISTILVLIPLTILVGLPVFTFFVLRYMVIPTKDTFLRQFPPARKLLAYYVELPVAWILLLYTVPGLYNLIGYLAIPCPPRAICYWGVQATEWLIMIHLATVFAVALILDAVRYWFRTRKMIRP